MSKMPRVLNTIRLHPVGAIHPLFDRLAMKWPVGKSIECENVEVVILQKCSKRDQCGRLLRQRFGCASGQSQANAEGRGGADQALHGKNMRSHHLKNLRPRLRRMNIGAVSEVKRTSVR